MISPKLLEIEKSINNLSLVEKLWLLENIARKIKLTQETGFFRKYLGPAQRSIFVKKPGFFGWVRKSCFCCL